MDPLANLSEEDSVTAYLILSSLDALIAASNIESVSKAVHVYTTFCNNEITQQDYAVEIISIFRNDETISMWNSVLNMILSSNYCLAPSGPKFILNPDFWANFVDHHYSFIETLASKNSNN